MSTTGGTVPTVVLALEDAQLQISDMGGIFILNMCANMCVNVEP